MERILSYDIFRGILLIAMVIFHVMVNLTNLQFDQSFFYWIPMGFIMFLGVILGQFLRDKSAKKINLALKLLLIFLGLNIYNFLTKDFGVLDLIKGDQTLFSFEILFPMSILIFSTLLLDPLREKWKTCLAICFFLLILMNHYSLFYYNLSFLLYGLLGYFLSIGVNLDQLARRYQGFRYASLFLFLTVALFLLQFVEIFDFILVFQVLALYFLSTILFKKSGLLTLLGKHSFALYISHILVIRFIVGN